MFSKYYKKYYKRRYKKRYKRRYTPLYKRVINNSSRSRVSVSITNQNEFAMRILAGQYWTPPAGIHPFVEVSNIPGGIDNNIYYKMTCSMVTTDLYQTFAKLYEQVKLDSMTVQITALTPMSNYNGSLEFHTAWDRKSSMNELRFTSSQAPPGGGYYPTTLELGTLASHSAAIATTNSIPIIRRTVWASDLLEKTQFLDTDHGEANATVYDVNGCTVHYNTDWMGPNYQTTSAQFCPILFFGVQSHTTFTTDVLIPFKFEVTYKVTFRNPKFGGSDGGQLKLKQKVPTGTTTALAQAINQQLANPIAEDTESGSGILEKTKEALSEAMAEALPQMTGTAKKMMRYAEDAKSLGGIAQALGRAWPNLTHKIAAAASGSLPTPDLNTINNAVAAISNPDVRKIADIVKKEL